MGFRNIAVHEYEKIDWNIVYAIITEKIDIFRSFTIRVMEYIEEG